MKAIKRMLLMSLILVATKIHVANGDGLIYNLPPDGSWATYRVVHHATDITTLSGESLADMKVESTFSIKSVGTETKNGQKHRWIELEYKRPPTKESEGRIIALKMLIPEGLLQGKADSLGGINELSFCDRDWDWEKEPEPVVKQILTDKPRIQYELERFRQQFPFSSQKRSDVRMVEGVSITTPLNTYSTELISYPMTFKGKLTGGKGGRWEWDGNYSLWLSNESPFGVVAVECETSSEEEWATADDDGRYQLNGQGMRMKVAMHLAIASIGENAKSSFPVQP